MDNMENEKRDDLLTLKLVYFHSVALAAQSVSQFQFHEDITAQSGVDRYILLDKHKEPAIFPVTGKLTHLSVTAAGAVQHRKPSTKVDEYTVRLQIEEEKLLKEVDSGITAVVDLLKNTPKTCENIAVSSGLVERKLSFKLDDMTIKVSNYSNDVFYFNRKVATKERKLVDDGQTPDFMLNFPEQGTDYPTLRYPTGWNLQPLIPVTDQEALELNTENVYLPRHATVYFEFRQGCYNFEGIEGFIKQIVLIPTIIAVKIFPPFSEDSTEIHDAKRRRLSC